MFINSLFYSVLKIRNIWYTTERKERVCRENYPRVRSRKERDIDEFFETKN